jgi:hypothetical protein
MPSRFLLSDWAASRQLPRHWNILPWTHLVTARKHFFDFWLWDAVMYIHMLKVFDSVFLYTCARALWNRERILFLENAVF